MTKTFVIERPAQSNRPGILKARRSDHGVLMGLGTSAWKTNTNQITQRCVFDSCKRIIVNIMYSKAIPQICQREAKFYEARLSSSKMISLNHKRWQQCGKIYSTTKFLSKGCMSRSKNDNFMVPWTSLCSSVRWNRGFQIMRGFLKTIKLCFSEHESCRSSVWVFSHLIHVPTPMHYGTTTTNFEGEKRSSENIRDGSEDTMI